MIENLGLWRLRRATSGAGTSTHMNANEVIAHRAQELMGHARCRYDVLHPNDHVNASQSTNGMYSSALRLAAWIGIDALPGEMAALRRAFEAKAAEFADVLKIGRTQFQDAMTLGQEFLAFALAGGTTIADAAHTLGVMSPPDMRALLAPQRLTQPTRLGATASDG